MALKLELEQWQSACTAFDSKDYDSALRTFISMADNAKMHFNIGLIFAAVDDHERALAAYARSIAMDPYFAVAYFQKGVSQFCLGNMEEAMREFDIAHRNLRNNQIVNYQQLGLAFRLYACEVLFNRGICRLYLGDIDAGLTDLYHAQKAKLTEEHEVIDQAVRDRGKGYSVFSIPVGVLYRPPESKLRQMHGNVDMFAAVDKLGLNKWPSKQPIHASLGRNNSVLMGPRFKRKQSLGYASLPMNATRSAHSHQQQPQPMPPLNTSSLSHYGSNGASPTTLSISTAKSGSYTTGGGGNIPLSTSSSSNSSLHHYRSPTTGTNASHDDFSSLPSTTPPRGNAFHSPYAAPPPPMPTAAAENSRYRQQQDPRRVDSGFESSAEDQYSSSSSRNSAKSHGGNGNSRTPPVPPMPRYDDDAFDPVAAYGTSTTTGTTASSSMGDLVHDFHHMAVDEERDRIRGRLNSSTHIDTDQLPPRRSSGTSARSLERPSPHPSTSSSTIHSLNGAMAGHRLKIKVHHTDTRVILVPANITFDDLFHRICDKLHAPKHTRLQYKDEEDEMVLMIDDDDLQLARQIHSVRNHKDQGVEKLEIWCIS
ncbi:hypothetical protein BC940DRAFT_113082 [Gongronella butleri]|nr:hypothetical protein BC940DRAFT_113082 [Gongronella butleri]